MKQHVSVLKLCVCVCVCVCVCLKANVYKHHFYKYVNL